MGRAHIVLSQVGGQGTHCSVRGRWVGRWVGRWAGHTLFCHR